MPKEHEQTLNLVIADILDGMRRNWSVSAEQVGVLRSGGRPDIVVSQKDKPSVLIENEFMPARGVEAEAAGRLGKVMSNGSPVRTVVALRSPSQLRRTTSSLKRAAAACEYEYALLTGEEPEVAERFPEKGWLTGSLSALSDFLHRASVPSDLLSKLTKEVERGVGEAAQMADDLPPDSRRKLEKILQQRDGLQTRRMAAAILLNALIFQETIADQHGIRKTAATCQTTVNYHDFDREWQKILRINYWPIFGVAREILLALPASVSHGMLSRLIKTVVAMPGGLLSSDDVFGRVFQRLIVDRQFLATFYTRPASAAFLAALAIPEDAPFKGGNWKNDAGDYFSADFACGTGALLSAVYRRIAELHEKAGGDMKKLHTRMMEETLIGCDVMPAAVHLTASMLSSMHPRQVFADTKLYVMPFGEPKKGEYKIGSLELLAKSSFLPVISASAEKAGGRGGVASQSEETVLQPAQLIIMNPPFTSPTNHEGANANVPNPAFAAFGADEKLQAKLGERSKQLRAGTCGDGNAGLGSDFVALANKKIMQTGTTAFVLPLSAMAGDSWKKVRALWAKNYINIRVVSLAAARAEDCSFSADTNMAEILFVGEKKNGVFNRVHKKEQRGVFISLHRRPQNEMEAIEFARIINRGLVGKINQLEDGPTGAFPLSAGETVIGGMLDAPLPPTPEDPWEISRIRDFSLAQTAHALAAGTLWLPGRTKRQAINLPVCRVDKFAKSGFISRDINGREKQNKVPRGPFDILPLSEAEPAPTYPCLWAADAKMETRLIVAPDRRGVIRAGRTERAHEIWQTASRVHHNVDCGFGSRPLTVAMTDKPTIGGRAWLNVYGFKNREQEDAFALWGNSTLGLLLYWWQSNKPQGARGTISPVRVGGMRVLDLTQLSATQLKRARRGFESMKNKTLLPFYRADEDKNRHALDEIILADVLGLSKETMDGVALIRRKLCQEPSVRGDKKTSR